MILTGNVSHQYGFLIFSDWCFQPLLRAVPILAGDVEGIDEYLWSRSNHLGKAVNTLVALRSYDEVSI